MPPPIYCKKGDFIMQRPHRSKFMYIFLCYKEKETKKWGLIRGCTMNHVIENIYYVWVKRWRSYRGRIEVRPGHYHNYTVARLGGGNDGIKHLILLKGSWHGTSFFCGCVFVNKLREWLREKDRSLWLVNMDTPTLESAAQNCFQLL